MSILGNCHKILKKPVCRWINLRHGYVFRLRIDDGVYGSGRQIYRFSMGRIGICHYRFYTNEIRLKGLGIMSDDSGFILCMIGALFLVSEGGVFWFLAYKDQIKLACKKFFKGG